MCKDFPVATTDAIMKGLKYKVINVETAATLGSKYTQKLDQEPHLHRPESDYGK